MTTDAATATHALPRRRLAAAAATATALAASGLARPAAAQGGTAAAAGAYPSRPVTLVVATPPGGTTDFTARLVAEPLSARLGVPVVVENRPGGGGVVGTRAAARAAPDGHTLALAYSGYVTGHPAVVGTAEFDPLREFAPVALLLEAPQVMLVHPSLPPATLAEFVAYAKARPGALAYASSGNGSLQHLGTELLKRRAGLDLLHVPYRGTGEAMNDVLSGRIAFYMTTPPSVAGHVRAGRLRALAMAGQNRHPALADVPSADEAGLPGFSAEAWFGLLAPAGTPRAVVERLAAECRAALADESLARRATEAGGLARFEGPEALRERMARETAAWAALVREAGIRPD